MKENPTCERLLSGYKFPDYFGTRTRAFHFNEEDEKELRFILREAATPEIIKEFLIELAFCCENKRTLNEQPERIDIRGYRKRILRDCKKTLNHLEEIKRGHVVFWNDDTIDQLKDKEDVQTKNIISMLDHARDSIIHLEQFMNLLNTIHTSEDKQTGRKKADYDNFIKEIAAIYSKHVGQPSTYETGPFYSLVQYVLKIMGMKYFTDPSRAIKSALKK